MRGPTGKVRVMSPHHAAAPPGPAIPRPTARLTAPFGRRRVSPAQVAAQAGADACPDGTAAHRWRVLHDLTAARRRFGLSAPALVVLEALLRFLPGDVLVAGSGVELMVFAANRRITERARGISEATLRRHLAALVEGGWLIRRDSPNGKRYPRRERRGGPITHAYGFDLSPLVARVGEIAAAAVAARDDELAFAQARETVTLLRRDGTKLIAALAEAEAEAGAETPAGPETARALGEGFAAVLAGLPRRPTLADLTAAGVDLEALVLAVSKALIARTKTQEMSGSGAPNERHQQSSKPDALDPEGAAGDSLKPAVADTPDKPSPVGPRPGTQALHPLSSVLDACPQIGDFAPAGIRSWRDLIDTAERVRPMLGISPDAWRDACAAMGADAAAVTLAAILERHEAITSPGGYLRRLTERKRAGTFTLAPVLKALHRRHLPAPATGGRVQ